MEILFAGVLPGVDVDHAERLRRLDDEIAAGFQPYPFAQRFTHEFFHFVKLGQRQQGVVIKCQFL